MGQPSSGADAGDSTDSQADTQREVERKLRVHALFRLPELDGLSPRVSTIDRQDTRSMTAVYHDTEDLRLFRWGVTLRRREGGNDAGWHMKLPVEGEGQGVRDELQVPLEDGEVGDVPAALSDLVTSLAREAPLVPVATLRTERIPFWLLDDEGNPLAELVDDTVSVIDADHIAARFRELEVEALSEEGLDVLDEVAAFLIDHGAVPGGTSKAAHALGPRASAAPDVETRGAVCPDDPAGDAVRAHLAKHVRRFLLQDVRVRRDLPDSVHQMRVAARRLRSGLKVFAPLVDAEWSAHLRGELGWIAGELGRVRDTEVLLERMCRHAEELDEPDRTRAVETIERVLGAEFDAARDHALTAMRSQRHRDLLVSLVDAVHHPHLTEAANRPCSEVLVEPVDKAFAKLAKKVHKLDPDGDAHPWHEARIIAKRARYAAEMVAPVFGRPAKRLAESLEGVTELLGDHQDCHVSQLETRVIADRPDVDGSSGFALALLHEREIEREHRLRAQFDELWPNVVKVYRKTEMA